MELVAPAVGGVESSDGQQVPTGQKIDGGPSVLHDAVVVLASKQGTPLLAALPAARDFVADAFAHCKFIGYTDDAMPLLEAAGLVGLIDDGPPTSAGVPPRTSCPAVPSCGSGRARPAWRRRPPPQPQGADRKTEGPNGPGASAAITQEGS